jgi:hypothetical protein
VGEQILADLARTGILGAFLVLALLVIRKLDRDGKAERERHAEAEKALLERVIASKDTANAKLLELAEQQKEAIAAIARRYERDSERRGR